MDYWRGIASFPAYSISIEGIVRKDATDQLMAKFVNNRGIVIVCLSQEGIQYTRSVALLMVNTFLPKPKLKPFNTPIHFDGNRENNHIDNLTLRPRWFAVKYYQQFSDKYRRGFKTPIEEISTGKVFKNSWEVATTFGLLERDVVEAISNQSFVWPTQQLFRLAQ
jgi:hypothetical protein